MTAVERRWNHLAIEDDGLLYRYAPDASGDYASTPISTEWETALAVFHGGVNRILLSHALAGGRTYFGTFEQAPACINVLDLGDDGAWIVRTVNYIPYDPLHPARTTTMEHLWSELAGWLDERTA